MKHIPTKTSLVAGGIALVGIFVLLYIVSVGRPNMSDMVLLGSFTSTDGHILGNLYVRYNGLRLEDTRLLSDIYIKDGSNKILFKMDRTGIYNLGDGHTISMGEEFYGYRIFSRDSEKMVVSIFTNGGRGIGDGVTIYWNYDKEMFKIFGPDPSDIAQ